MEFPLNRLTADDSYPPSWAWWDDVAGVPPRSFTAPNPSRRPFEDLRDMFFHSFRLHRVRVAVNPSLSI